MGFNKITLPEYEELKKIREKFETDEEFVRHVQRKADAITGSVESMDYFFEILQKLQREHFEKKERERGF